MPDSKINTMRIDQTKRGVLALITDHGYAEDVFDIQQSDSICLLLKNKR